MKKKSIILIIILCIFIVGCSNNKTVNNKKIEKEDKDVYYKDYLFSKYYKDSINKVKKMSLEEKVGQVFLVRYDKNSINTFNKYYPGGYVLFAKDFQDHTKDSIKSELDNDQKISKYPLIMAVDEEGGYVTRVSRFSNFRDSKFLSNKYYLDNGGYEELEKIEREKAKLLKSIGLNLNLAPVADVSTNPNDFIYNRTFGMDAKGTSEAISKMVEYANSEKIGSCLKHFPGYGNNIDTHTGIAIDERSYDSISNNDYLPFKSGIDSGVPSILVSHNIVKCIDEKYPASLSNKVISGELRDKLKFTGVVITDDLAMDAVKSYTENGEAATLALKAGNDLIITSDFINMYNEVLKNVKSGIIDEKVLDEAVIRITAFKEYLNLY